ncbi:MAG: hypothetical protein GEV10_23520 [Streptosporangiales bacterium]|nr:hypothetical protein [Streptosporangiales bacterium]
MTRAQDGGTSYDRRRFLRTAGAGVLLASPLAAGLTSCGSDDESSGKKKRVRIAQTSPPLITYPAVVWGPVTYGAEFGVPTTKKDFTTFEAQQTAIQSLLSGRADIVIGSFLGMLALATKRDDFITFGPSVDLDDFVLAGIKGVNDCDSVFDPKYKIGVDSPGGSGSSVLEAILQDGCDGRSQKELKNVRIIESSGLRTTSLASGEIQATVLHIDQTEQVKEKIGTADFHEIHALYKVKNFIRSAMATTRDWLDENEDAAAGLVAATFKAHRVMMKDYDKFVEAVKDVVDEPPTEDSAYRLVWNLARKYRFWPINAEESLQQTGVDFMAKIGVSSGAFKKPPDTTKLVERKIIEKAEKMVGPMTREELLS